MTPPLGFNDVKEFAGRRYTGVRVGGRHEWTYPEGRWLERKLSPRKWEIRFASQKRRRHEAPEGSGSEPGTKYHWLVVGHQRVVKQDANTYQTLLEGSKFLVAHQRPRWRRWSSEYPGQSSARREAIRHLEAVLDELRERERNRAPGLERELSALPEWRPPGQLRLGVEWSGARWVDEDASLEAAYP